MLRLLFVGVFVAAVAGCTGEAPSGTGGGGGVAAGGGGGATGGGTGDTDAGTGTDDGGSAADDGGSGTGGGTGADDGGSGTGGGGGTDGGTGPGCQASAATWTVADTASNVFAARAFGNYVVSNNNWTNTRGQTLWAVDGECWGVSTTFTDQANGNLISFPNVSRGWTQNGTVMQQLSTPGTQDWTTRSGMGIRVTELTKARVHWAFEVPTTTGWRWLGLMDVYFHKSATPSSTEFPPFVDLMIDQSLMDQVLPGQAASSVNYTYYSAVANQNHPAVKTLGGVTYLLYVDASGEASFHQAGGHTIHLFRTPTHYTDRSGALWGTLDGRHDLKAIIDFFRQPNPTDDSGHPLTFADGAVVTSALITDDLHLSSAQAGWEIVSGTSFTNGTFCLAMQNEPDCP